MTRVTLVTGSSSGIGAAVARACAARGDQVVVHSRASVEAGEAVAREIGAGAVYVQADLGVPDECERLVAATLARFGRLDAVVNNAGTTRVIAHADLEAAGPEVWLELYAVNVVAPWLVTRAAVPALRESGSGAVVNVSSLAGVRPVGSSIPYACSKAALNHQTRLLASSLGPAVRVNAVAPGLVDTPWTAGDGPDGEYWSAIRAGVTAGAPLQRAATPSDVVGAVLFLLDAPYVTGEVLLVDGGLGLR